MTSIALPVLGTDIEPSTFGIPVVEAINKLGKGVSLQRSTAQSVPHTTATAITWDTEDYDTDGYHSTSSNTSRITIPAGLGGMYWVTYRISQAGADNQWQTWVHKNGSSTVRYGELTVLNNATVGPSSGLSFPMVLAAGDYIELIAFQNRTGGTALNFITATNRPTGFGATLIGPS